MEKNRIFKKFWGQLHLEAMEEEGRTLKPFNQAMSI